jgi:hypothetical protein
MSEYNVADIIDLAIDGDVVAIQTAVNDIMKERVAEVLAAKKIEVGKTLLNPEE